MLGTIIDLLNWLWGKLKWAFIVVMPLFGLITFMTEGIELITDGLTDLTTRIHDLRLMVTASLGPVTPFLSYANAFFPLTEIFAMAALWAGIKITIVVIRLIKGAIPTYG